VAPFPYNVADVTFASEQAGVVLAGTLTWPEGAGPFPAVVLITGSGAQDRNEELPAINHRPFLVLADALTRAGVAVLRYDDVASRSRRVTSRRRPPRILRRTLAEPSASCASRRRPP
jgi:predicted alpha/beta-hydrolase family hydrolase